MPEFPLSISAGIEVESRVALTPPVENVNEVHDTRNRGPISIVLGIMGTDSKVPVYFVLSIPPNRIEPN